VAAGILHPAMFPKTPSPLDALRQIVERRLGQTEARCLGKIRAKSLEEPLSARVKCFFASGFLAQKLFQPRQRPFCPAYRQNGCPSLKMTM